MAWIRRAGGVFSLHDSDNHCGSYITIPDAAAVLEVPGQSLENLPSRIVQGAAVLSELDVHKAWGRGDIVSPQQPKIGNASRSVAGSRVCPVSARQRLKSTSVPSVSFGHTGFSDVRGTSVR